MKERRANTSSKECELLDGVLSDGFIALLPVRRADLAVFVGVLITCNKTKNFRDGATNGRVIEGDVADNALRVNNVGRATRETGIS